MWKNRSIGEIEVNFIIKNYIYDLCELKIGLNILAAKIGFTYV